MLAAGGLMLASQQAGAVIVPSATDDDLLNLGVLLESTSHFEGETGYIYEATATTDSNLFASIGVQDGAGFAGWARHIDVGAVAFANGGALSEGMALRMSAWVMSNPNDPFSNPVNPLNTPPGEDGFRMEFLNVPLGSGLPGNPDLILTTPLSPVGTGLSTSGWTQKSFSFELSNNPLSPNFVDFANLQEVRAVMAQSGGVGATGEIFADNFKFEVFPSLAAATNLITNPLPSGTPGAFDVPPPPPVLNGDICCGGPTFDGPDGFVGIEDLNVVLSNWNATPPPPSLSPVLLSDFSSFNLTGTYNQFGAGTFTSGATDWTVQANDFGGGWFDFPGTIDATGRTDLEIQLDVNPGNIADIFNIVLFDADGTQRVFRFLDLVVGDNQTLTINLDDFFQDNAPGTIAGLDLSTIDLFHIQGTFANGDPGLLLDLTIDNLELFEGVPLIAGDINKDDFVGIEDLNVVLGEWNLGTPPPPGGAIVPEPATLSLLAFGGLTMLRRRTA